MITIQEAQHRVARMGWSEDEVFKLLSPADQAIWTWAFV